MPPNNNLVFPRTRARSLVKKPPEPITWSKGAPIVILAFVFDALRFFFTMFWFLGPALAALYCTDAVNSTVGATIAGIGGKIVAAGCTAAAGVAGFFTAPALETFGVIMAMAIGLIGWMLVGFIIITTNARGIKENSGNVVWFVVSLMLSEIPFLDAAPALSVTVFKMYYTQIKKEKADWETYEKEYAAEQLQMKNQQLALLTEAQNRQLAEIQEQEAVNDAVYEEEALEDKEDAIEQNRMTTEAENDAQYTPEMRKVA